MNSILFIAPHQEIADKAQNILEYMGISIPVITASNQDAVQAAISYRQASIVISRGGTARDIRTSTDKMVVDIHTAFIDISTAVQKLAAQGSKDIAIVSANNIIENARIKFDFGQTSVRLCPCVDDDDIIREVKELYSTGIDGIAGDIKAIRTAAALNIQNRAYIKSGDISITKAIEEALALANYEQVKQLRLKTMQSIIDNIDEGIIVYDQNHHIIFSNKEGQSIIKNGSIFSLSDRQKNFSELLHGYKGKIMEINSEKVLLDIIQLNVTKDYQNDILIFQKVSNIENSARKIRSALHQKGLYAKKNFDDIIYSSEKMKIILMTANKFAESNSTVLIYGETGTGKEGLAQSIHNASSRRDKPFVSVNCASLPPTLIESELFGYVDGAFTGARRSGKKGLFEMAHTGTIFLDEIGDLPLDMQSRLLRVLQEREIMRIGDDKILPIDIRLICATNKNLKNLIRDGLFRQDLYYRINVLRITLPPLRERREDIMPLFYFYLDHYIPDRNDTSISLPVKITDYLQNYPWYGNVRELKNAAEVMAFSYNKNISLPQVKNILDDDLNETSEDCILNINAGGNLKTIEKDIIYQLLKKYSADEVCHMLNISRVTLWRKCK
ncbi:sigma 54-interacting transcriptional regulator [Pectinatus haikarae]|uniref:sigma 54-interacting transcriptional regulator n=1 Tax=Pectinatus haikarae TaxID=349096 RepID=UPI0018C80037|nr:sigma 54-interacting transcriptional regulator [Pectinatus haikarae]